MTDPFIVFKYPGTVTVQREITPEKTDPITGHTTPAEYGDETPLLKASLHTRSSTRSTFSVTTDTIPNESFHELYLVTNEIFGKRDIITVYPISGFDTMTFNPKNTITERPLFQTQLGINQFTYHLISVIPHTDPLVLSSDQDTDPPIDPDEDIEDLSW